MQRTLFFKCVFLTFFLSINLFADSKECKKYDLVLKPHLFLLTSSLLYEEQQNNPIYTIEHSFFEWTISHTHQVKDPLRKTLYKSYNSVFNPYDRLFISTVDKNNLHEKEAYSFSKTHLISSSQALSDEYLLIKNDLPHPVGKLYINLEKLNSFEFYSIEKKEMIAKGVLKGNQYKIELCNFHEYPELHILLSMFLTTKTSMLKISRDL